MNEQSVSYINSKDPFMYYDEAKKSFLAAADPKWKQAVMDKFDWIKNIEESKGPNCPDPAFYANSSDTHAIEQTPLNILKQ